jgi:5-hydroxyisourate hydrolase-like protein (transthyretin family)
MNLILAQEESKVNYIHESPSNEDLSKLVDNKISALLYGEGVISQEEVDAIYGLAMYNGTHELKLQVMNKTTNLPIKDVKFTLRYKDDLQGANMRSATTDSSGKIYITNLQEGFWELKLLDNQDSLSSLTLYKGEFISEVLVGGVTPTLDFEFVKIV